MKQIESMMTHLLLPIYFYQPTTAYSKKNIIVLVLFYKKIDVTALQSVLLAAPLLFATFVLFGKWEMRGLCAARASFTGSDKWGISALKTLFYHISRKRRLQSTQRLLQLLQILTRKHLKVLYA